MTTPPYITTSTTPIAANKLLVPQTGTLAIAPNPTAGQGLALDPRGAAPNPTLRRMVGKLSAGPPAFPFTGQIWIATNVDANGTVWQFCYNGTSSSTYKWEFIGGSKLGSVITTQESTASGSLTDLATVGPSVTATRAGDYWVHFGFTGVNDTNAGNGNANVMQNGSATALAVGTATPAITADQSVAYYQAILTAVPAAALLKLEYSVSNATTYKFSNRHLSILPVRVS